QGPALLNRVVDEKAIGKSLGVHSEGSQRIESMPPPQAQSIPIVQQPAPSMPQPQVINVTDPRSVAPAQSQPQVIDVPPGQANMPVASMPPPSSPRAPEQAPIIVNGSPPPTTTYSNVPSSPMVGGPQNRPDTSCAPGANPYVLPGRNTTKPGLFQ